MHAGKKIDGYFFLMSEDARPCSLSFLHYLQFSKNTLKLPSLYLFFLRNEVTLLPAFFMRFVIININIGFRATNYLFLAYQSR